MKSTVFAVMALLSLTSCHKDWTLPQEGPTRYQVTKLKYPSHGSVDSLVIQYDHRGNPASTLGGGRGTGSRNYIFRYDKKGRLRDLINVYLPDQIGYESWTRFSYNNKNQVVADTGNTFGRMENIPPPDEDLGYPQPHESVNAYTYDNKNRIVRVNNKYLAGEIRLRQTEYFYDQKGNRTSMRDDNGPLRFFQFDNKVSVNSTHPIWQFLSRDFSVNNPFTASMYNNWKLPTDVSLSGEYGYADFLGLLTVSEINITYKRR